jgi:hypothetical protein
MILIFGRETFVIKTAAQRPHLGVQDTSVEACS